MTLKEYPPHVQRAKLLGWTRLSNHRAYSEPRWTGVPPGGRFAVIIPEDDLIVFVGSRVSIESSPLHSKLSYIL